MILSSNDYGYLLIKVRRTDFLYIYSYISHGRTLGRHVSSLNHLKYNSNTFSLPHQSLF